MGMWESTKYPSLRMDGLSRWFQFEMGPRSVITRPSGGQKLSGPGFYEISGLAWSGGGCNPQGRGGPSTAATLGKKPKSRGL